MSRKFLSDAQRSFNVEVNRNTFDASKTHNVSYNFGYIYPIRVIPVSPNETYRIKTTGGFDLKPMIGVSQTHVKCNTAWFYCRDFQVWKNANKYHMQDPTVADSKYPHPVINSADKKAFSKGSLLNHMSVPVSTVGIYPGNAVVPVVDSAFSDFTSHGLSGFLNVPSQTYSVNPSFSYAFLRRSYDSWLNAPDGDLYCHRTVCYNNSVLPNLLGLFLNNNYSSGYTHSASIFPVPMTKRLSDQILVNPWSFVFHHINRTVESVTTNLPTTASLVYTLSFYADVNGGSIADAVRVGSFDFRIDGTGDSAGSVSIINQSEKSILASNGLNFPVKTSDLKITPYIDTVSSIQALQDKYGSLYLVLSHYHTSALTSNIMVPNVYAGNVVFNSEVTGDEPKPASFNVTPGFFGGFEYQSDVLVNTDVDSPFCGLGTDAKEHLNALPVRHYEAIINSHFRDRILDPFRIDGEVQIDRYNTNQDDGLDSTTPLELAKCRYQSDYFTTCIPSPQGNMFNQPLVGITMAADPVDGSADLHYSENGQEYVIGVQADAQGKMIGMNYNSEDANRLTVLTLKDAISYGISLQDIENRRALAKWYEATYRRGRFSSDDFIEAHFGKRPTSDAMHAPEYLGGDSLPLSVMRVLNNSSADGGVLGASGGLGSFATKKDDPGVIECFCDKPGFIIGVCWFSVTPTYSQAIEKFWYRKLPSDYPVVEFANLGTMPVLNKELAPLLCNWDDASADDFSDGTFGYQRIYGDKLSSFDTAAGDYLDELNPLLLFRLFNKVPTLGVDFVTQNPGDMNNIFVLDNDRDKIYGQWHFDVKCKLWFNQTPNAQIF